MNTDITHVSFDMWNTLITPNREYATQRAKYLAHTSGKSAPEARAIYTHVKRMADKMAEDFGTQFSVNQLYSILVRALGITKDVESRAYEIQKTLEYLFIEHPPELHPELPELLVTLRRKHLTTNVLSNTNFIPGRILEKVITHPLRASHGFWFDSEFYSDQEGIAKPCADFFGKITHRSAGSAGYPWAHNVLHVGDNNACDYDGAKAAGMKAQLVTDPADTVRFLKEHFHVA